MSAAGLNTQDGAVQSSMTDIRISEHISSLQDIIPIIPVLDYDEDVNRRQIGPLVTVGSMNTVAAR